MKTVRIFYLVLTTLFILSAASAENDTEDTSLVNGTGILNCTSDKQSKIYIDSVEFNSSLCNITDTTVIQHFRNICNGRTVCEFRTLNEIRDLNMTCPLNGTDSNLLDVNYHCVRNGMWSKWSDYSICSVTCGRGIQTRSRMCSNPAPNENGQNCSGNNVDERNCNTQNCSNPFTKHYFEEEVAYLTCSIEFNEIMKITTIKYEKGTCSHNDLYGIGNLCDGRTKCAFNVTNSNVGSSCGANGTASLGITYNCIRNGGWSDWKNTTACPVNCGGALQNLTRTCTNPAPNEFGASCSGTSFDEQICNDNACPLRGTLCKDNGIVWTCQNGYIEMIRARWKATSGCGEPGSLSNFDVLREMKNICNTRQSCTFTANDGTFKLSCRQHFKTCSQLEFEYICKDAKWNTWTEWSTCSKSCSTGEQVRTRSCINQLNTTDGYLIDCEGLSEESRVCNTIQCPYCNGNTFPHQMPSNSKLKKEVSTNSGMTDIYKIGCCGIVNAFQFIPMNTGEMDFIVWRRKTGHTYKAIKKYTISVTAQNIGKYVQHNLTNHERIAVVHNDIVGWYDGGNNIIGYYDCSPDNETCLTFSLMKNPVNNGDEIDTDGLPSISDKIFAWSFSTTENMALELTFADDSFEIPDHFAVDTYVTHIGIKDPDYGDFIENIELDYDNQYFYFDTKLRNVYVKDVLPHTVGQKLYSHNITLTVQDSCFNRITTNVTISIYNAPPVISGLQKNLEIDPTTAVSDPYLAKFQVKDPSGDNVSCMINETNAATELFVLKFDDIDVYLKLVNNVSIQSNTSSEFILTITCGDGTEDTKFELLVKFGPKNEGTPTVPSKDANAIPIIIGVCVLILCLTILVIFACIWKKRRKLVVNEPSEDKLNHATCSIAAGVTENPYHDMGQTAEQHNTNDYVEMAAKQPAKEKAFHLGTTEVGAYTEAWR